MLRGTRPFLQLTSRATSAKSFRCGSLPSQLVQPPTLLLPKRSHPNTRQPLSPFSALHRHYTTKGPGSNTTPDKKLERELAQKEIEARPGEVSSESSVRHVFESSSAATPKDNSDVTQGLKHDVGIVVDTFSLNNVPREPYALGLAGTLPYLATSLTTVYLSWDLNTQWPSTSTFLNHIYMNHDSAQYWLGMLEPIQLGYGAVIISFLGAIHWGMEFTEKSTSSARTRFRYGMGVLAPALAWPTLLMPIEYALTTQFAAFIGLYLADSRASTRGWAPTWYGTYRFVLTAVVGVALFVSLVGRAKIGGSAPRLGQGLADKMHKDSADKNTDWAKLEKEEKEKIKKEKQEEERRKKEEEEEKKKEAKEKKSDVSGNAKKKDKKSNTNEEGKDDSGDKKQEESDK